MVGLPVRGHSAALVQQGLQLSTAALSVLAALASGTAYARRSVASSHGAHVVPAHEVIGGFNGSNIHIV